MADLNQTQAETMTMDEAIEAVELAWGIIANAGGGDWSTQTQEWQDAAARWRDRFLPALSASLAGAVA